MYFSIIHLKIAYRLSIGIKISDLWMTLNGLMTADELIFYVALTIWPKIGLGHERRWPRPKRDMVGLRLEAVSICFLGAL